MLTFYHNTLSFRLKAERPELIPLMEASMATPADDDSSSDSSSSSSSSDDSSDDSGTEDCEGAMGDATRKRLHLFVF